MKLPQWLNWWKPRWRLWRMGNMAVLVSHQPLTPEDVERMRREWESFNVVRSEDGYEFVRRPSTGDAGTRG